MCYRLVESVTLIQIRPRTVYSPCAIVYKLHTEELDLNLLQKRKAQYEINVKRIERTNVILFGNNAS